MTVNIYDTINQLEKELRETDEYKKLEAAHQAIVADPEAKEIFEIFRKNQQNLQSKQQAGEEITEDDFKQFQDLSAQMAGNERTKKFIDAERNVHQIFLDVNRTLEKPILKFYQSEDK